MSAVERADIERTLPYRAKLKHRLSGYVVSVDDDALYPLLGLDPQRWKIANVVRYSGGIRLLVEEL